MRGEVPSQPNFVSLINVETMIAAHHPIRVIKRMCDAVLREMSAHFDEIYAAKGAPSIPPETLLKAKVLQALYTVRSDRQLCARMQTDLMFRWFVDLPLDEAVFDASTFSKNQQRLLAHEVADLFFSEVVELARRHGWVSDDHFSVDGTLIEAWASVKSFQPKGTDQGPGSCNGWTDFKGQKRSNDTHASTTDPEAKLVRKGEHTKEVHVLRPERRIGSAEVIALVKGAIAAHGAPQFIRSDNGPEFIAKDLQQWLAEQNIKTIYITPASPWENGFVESFHSRFRDECLNREQLWTLTEARVVIEDFRQEYNTERPHSSLGYESLRRFAARNTLPIPGSGPGLPTTAKPTTSTNNSD